MSLSVGTHSGGLARSLLKFFSTIEKYFYFNCYCSNIIIMYHELNLLIDFSKLNE